MVDRQESAGNSEILGYSALKPDSRRLYSLLISGAILVTACYALTALLSPIWAHHAREPALRIRCSSNLKQISLGAIMYANAHGGHFPDDLDTIFQEEDIPPYVFTCPASAVDLPVAPTTQATYSALKQQGHLSYIYVGKGLTIEAPSDVVLLYEPLSDHSGDGMNVCFADGHVEWLTSSEAKSILQQADAGVRPVLYPPAPTTSPATRTAMAPH
jgi:prepilin-type processing-associated H-X9-DG protein